MFILLMVIGGCDTFVNFPLKELIAECRKSIFVMLWYWSILVSFLSSATLMRKCIVIKSSSFIRSFGFFLFGIIIY